jgi:hypothetical protein
MAKKQPPEGSRLTKITGKCPSCQADVKDKGRCHSCGAYFRKDGKWFFTAKSRKNKDPTKEKITNDAQPKKETPAAPAATDPAKDKPEGGVFAGW